MLGVDISSKTYVLHGKKKNKKKIKPSVLKLEFWEFHSMKLFSESQRKESWVEMSLFKNFSSTLIILWVYIALDTSSYMKQTVFLQTVQCMGHNTTDTCMLHLLLSLTGVGLSPVLKRRLGTARDVHSHNASRASNNIRKLQIEIFKWQITLLSVFQWFKNINYSIYWTI